MFQSYREEPIISAFTPANTPIEAAGMKTANPADSYRVPALSASSSNDLPSETEFRGRVAMLYEKDAGGVVHDEVSRSKLHKRMRRNSEDPAQINNRQLRHSSPRTSHNHHRFQYFSQKNKMTSVWNPMEPNSVKTGRTDRPLESNKDIPACSAARPFKMLSSKGTRAKLPNSPVPNDRHCEDLCNHVEYECFSENVPADRKLGGPNSGMKCQFCGHHGHGLAECSETASSELAKLEERVFVVDKLGMRNGDVICMRCLGKGHWGAECQLKNEDMFALTQPNEVRPSKSHAKEHEAGVMTACHRANMNSSSHTIRMLRNPVEKCHDDHTSKTINRQDSSADVQTRHILLNRRSREYILENKVKSPTHQTGESGGKHGQHMRIIHPKNKGEDPQFESNRIMASSYSDILELIEANRLSRADLFELANDADVSSRAKGYFIRVRFGKWEEDLGGTGYRMARIKGIDVNVSARLLSMLVDLGDIECKVGSQYVSNQGFTQEEVAEWWKVMALRGKTIPQRRDLEAKHEERQSWAHSKML